MALTIATGFVVDDAMTYPVPTPNRMTTSNNGRKTFFDLAIVFSFARLAAKAEFVVGVALLGAVLTAEVGAGCESNEIFSIRLPSLHTKFYSIH